MFKKQQKRNLRLRKEDSEEDDTDAINVIKKANGAAKTSLKNLKKKKGKSKTQPEPAIPKSESKSLLSFGLEEEEEEETFQLKKSSRSKRIAKNIKKLAQEEREQTQSGTGNYTREKLAELKKASSGSQSLRTYGIEEEDILHGSDVEDNIENQGGFSNLNSQSLNGGDFSELRPGQIPNANLIHAARKRREMMRKYGSDYIPIEKTETVEKESSSRLVRETDLGSSGEEEGPSVAMKGIIDDSVRVANEIGDQGEGPLQKDEEFDLWEAEMIKKGISTQQPGKRSEEENRIQEYPPPQAYQYSTNVYSSNGDYRIGGYTTPVAKSSSSKTAMSPSDTVLAVKKRIADRLECLRQVHQGHKLDAQRSESDIKESEQASDNLLDTTRLSKEYTFFQDIRAYVKDLVDCLNEKMVEIESLETRRHNIWKERAELFINRRQQDIRDESSDVTLSLASGKIASVPPVEAEKQMRTREREARRSRRRAAREKAGTLKTSIDGMSTDEEETSMEKAKFSAELEKMRNDRETLFDDVVEEFYDVQVIISRFKEWKMKHPDSYNDAYIGLCLPRVLTPFVKIAMMNWNPLVANSADFECMKWYEDLLFYGVEGKEDEGVLGDSDSKILSMLFEKVILPKLSALVRDIWDPLSKSQSRRLAIFIKKAMRTYPCMRTENKKCNELVTNLCIRIQRSIDNDIFIPLYPTSALTDTHSGPSVFFERQTWTCIKLYENIFLFDGILKRSVLQELGFTSLLNRYIMLSLQTSPITTASVQKCQRISNAIPSEWLEKDCIEETLPHLASFSRYLLHSATHIYNNLAGANEMDKRRAGNCILVVSRILAEMGAKDFANQVSML